MKLKAQETLNDKIFYVECGAGKGCTRHHWIKLKDVRHFIQKAQKELKDEILEIYKNYTMSGYAQKELNLQIDKIFADNFGSDEEGQNG